MAVTAGIRGEWVLPASMLVGSPAWSFGQVLGAATGALVAARVGFRLSSVVAAGMLRACSALVSWRVLRGKPHEAAATRERKTSLRELGTVSLAVLAGSTQVFFLTAILPQILPPLGVPLDSTLEVGGALIFAAGMAASLGSMGAPPLADLLGERRAVLWFLLDSALLLAALAGAGGVWSFGVLRFLQVLGIAPVFPLSVAAIAQRASAEVISFVNSARIGAAFVGPVLATTFLSSLPPAAVYLVLAGPGLSVGPLVARLDRRSRPRYARGGGVPS
jgi:hypothetical protein